MQSYGFPKHLLIAFGMALLGYILLYSCDRHLRSRKGAWEFTFSSSSNGEPVLTIDQPHYGISKVRIVMEGESFEGPTRRLRFDQPGLEMPFGEAIFFDTTYLPGSVTFDLFGHELEVLPRTLIINFKEHPWQVGEVIKVKPDEAWTRQVEVLEQNQP